MSYRFSSKSIIVNFKVSMSHVTVCIPLQAVTPVISKIRLKFLSTSCLGPLESTVGQVRRLILVIQPLRELFYQSVFT